MANVDFSAMNPDLASERRNVQFNAFELTKLLYGGTKAVERRRMIANFVESNRAYDDPTDITFMSREERLENGARKAAAMVNENTAFPAENLDELLQFRILAMAGDFSPFELHDIAGLPYVLSQADEDQLNEWGALMSFRAVNVAYAQTELGHGSNMRRLETTATYDSSTKEFVINSPTTTSMKWWAGNLGKCANYAIVMAQLFTQGRHRGLHAFLVPVRHPETHKLLPGVLLGDIGPKFGMPGNDNGFARFTNVRIPRGNMLMRYAKVKPDGTYVPPVHQKLSYGGMVYIRAMMISVIGYGLELACTIAVRYSCVRRQGDSKHEVDGDGSSQQPERKLLDYQTQQYRLLPELAKAFAIHFVGASMRSMYAKVNKELRGGDVSNLARLHMLSAGLKAVITREAAVGIEICRLSCGGHGFSMACGIPELYTYMVAGCTYEGDNIILLLQTARALVKEAKSRGTRILEKGVVDRTKSTFSLEELRQIYHLVASQMVQDVSQLLTDCENRGSTPEAAWDSHTVELCRVAKASVRAFIVENFLIAVNEQSDPSVRRVLSLLYELHAVCGVQARAGDFMEHAGLTKSQMHLLRNRRSELLKAIRPAAVQLVDAFEFLDRQLRSVLGRYDGNVYENLFDWAQKSPLNKVEVLDTFPKYLEPMMRDGRSKL